MKLIIDMNLPPEWVPILAKHGYEAEHWSTVGSISAEDSEIMDWARQNDCVVFTHDLDFSAPLAASGAGKPSIFQVRTLAVLPSQIEALVVAALKQFQPILEARHRLSAWFGVS
jgi:predicted nuclease of predicted toxin-antitoxin system